MDTTPITREQCLGRLEAFISKKMRWPNPQEMSSAYDLFDRDDFERLVGTTPLDYTRDNYPQYADHTIPKEQIHRMFQRYIAEHGVFPTYTECKELNDLPDPARIRYCFDMKPSEYHKTFFPDVQKAPSLRPGRPHKNYALLRDEYINALESFLTINGRLPKTEEMGDKEGWLPSKPEFQKATGYTYSKYLKEFHPDLRTPHLNRIYTRELCEEKVEQFIRLNGRRPRNSDFVGNEDYPGFMTFERVMGISLYRYCMTKHPELSKSWTVVEPTPLSREEAIENLASFVRENARLPERHELQRRRGLAGLSVLSGLLGEPLENYLAREYPELPMPSYSNGRTIWSEQHIRESIDAFIEDHGRLPMSQEFRVENNLPSPITWGAYMSGTISEYLAETYPHMKRYRKALPTVHATYWSVERMEEAVQDFIEANGRLPLVSEFRSDQGLPIPGTWKQYMREPIGSYLARKYPNTERLHRYCENVTWNQQEIEKAVQAFVGANHRTPVSREFDGAHNLPSTYQFCKVMGENPIEYLHRLYPTQAKWNSPERCTQPLDTFIQCHGHFPHADEFRARNGLPPYNVFRTVTGETPLKYMKRTYPQLAKEHQTWGERTTLWTKDSCIQALTSYVQKHGEAPGKLQCNPQAGMPSRSTFLKYVGVTPVKYAYEHLSHLFAAHDGTHRPNPNPGQRREKTIPQKPKATTAVTWNRESITNALQEYSNTYGRYPSLQELGPEQNLPSQRTVELLYDQPYLQVVDTLHRRIREQIPGPRQEDTEPEPEEDGGLAWGMSM